ncbi:LANO_0G17942g1_1 [Lachancea nothofagi CBS 11611]|uniref:LANO_0G17942g1_1 n=1 Tax=Lachancea nothofagi CBS 11611 TaxID=1266666 RepID=A0A1G4KKR2_9SACH|nr:LANO_0G17942g1_1 [Lachancea nothofagi CBS 11611]
MLFGKIALTALLGVTGALGLTVKQPHVAFTSSKRSPLALSPITNNYKKLTKPMSIDNANETLELNFSINSDETPQQAVLLLGSISEGLETHFEPIIKTKEGVSTYKFTIPIDQLPEPLLLLAVESRDLLTASLILASEGAVSDNLFVELFDLSLVFDVDRRLSKSPRLEAMPEIKHIFRGASKTVPAWVAQSTSLIIIACFFLLLVAWVALGVFSSVSLSCNTKSLYLLAFIGSVCGMEYVFIRYYLGASIFETLEHAFYASLGGILSGAKLLISLTK